MLTAPAASRRKRCARCRAKALMGLLVPAALGGPGRSMSQVASVCHALGAVLRFLRDDLCDAPDPGGLHRRARRRERLAPRAASRRREEQLLLGSVTSEAGTGGNIHASVCAVETAGRPRATGEEGDHHLLRRTRRRAADHRAPQPRGCRQRPGDGGGVARRLRRWTGPPAGTRWACAGPAAKVFVLRFAGRRKQILPVPFSDIAGQTMLPVSHLLWASVWLGIATGAMNRARNYLRQQVRERGNVSMMSHRLARAVGLLQLHAGAAVAGAARLR